LVEFKFQLSWYYDTEINVIIIPRFVCLTSLGAFHAVHFFFIVRFAAVRFITIVSRQNLMKSIATVFGFFEIFKIF